MSLERTVGRKPDPGLEDRVFQASLAIYAEVGWAGFTLDAVCRRAKVGKAAVYGRWDDKAALLIDALLTRQVAPEVIDTGTIRGDLIGVANVELEMWGGQLGRTLRRAAMDAVTYPEILGPVRDTYRRSVIQAGRDIIARAIARGELPEGASSALILDAISGSIDHRLAYIPDDRRAEFDRRAPEYVETLVDFVLAAATTVTPKKDTTAPHSA